MSHVYRIITERIVALLQKGTVPWRQPWNAPRNAPKNIISGKPYRGINALILGCAGFGSPYWLTYRQAQSLEGQVRKGEHGIPCIYYSRIEKDTGNPEGRDHYAVLRYYTLFNLEQCVGIPTPEEPPIPSQDPIQACEAILEGMPNPPALENNWNEAFYVSQKDMIGMPPRERFHSPEEYYSTLFHELIHSTGHSSRLARPGIVAPRGIHSPTYSTEELIAEIGAAYLCGETGIGQATINNAASYIQSWISRLRNDHGLVIRAASQAQKASDYILNVKETDSPEENASFREASTPSNAFLRRPGERQEGVE